MLEPIVEVGKDKIYPLIMTPQNLEKFWEKAQQFPTLYGHQIVGDINAFLQLFFVENSLGEYESTGLFWVLNPEEFTGVFFLEDIRRDGDKLVDAQVHYTFFDRRHHGRDKLMREMLKYVFTRYDFQRLSANIPNYSTPQARRFAQVCGFNYEGKKCKSAYYKNDWFDTNLYGILKSEVLV